MKAAISLSLAADKISFTKFFNVVGEAVYGREWQKQSAKRPRNLDDVVSDEVNRSMIYRINDDLTTVLAGGIIRSGFSESIDMFHPKSEVDENRETDDSNLLDEDETIRFDFTIRRDFWSRVSVERTEVWATSEAFIDHDCLDYSRSGDKERLVDRTKGPLQFMPDPFPHSIYIINPSLGFQRLFKEIDMPDGDYLARYRSYRSAMVEELVTAGWRYLAINQPVDKHGIKAEIAKAIMDYYSHQQGNEPPLKYVDKLSTANNIADKIHKQWISRDLKSSVLVNSARAPKSNKPK